MPAPERRRDPLSPGVVFRHDGRRQPEGRVVGESDRLRFRLERPNTNDGAEDFVAPRSAVEGDVSQDRRLEIIALVEARRPRSAAGDRRARRLRSLDRRHDLIMLPLRNERSQQHARLKPVADGDLARLLDEPVQEWSVKTLMHKNAGCR